MGFDINVMMSLLMCPETGKPYYYGVNKETRNFDKVYGLPELSIPQDLRSYLVGRGHIFHAYTEFFNENQQFNVDVDEFLGHFPSWEEVQQNTNYIDDDDYWSEKDHKAFYELLQWCSKQYIEFRVSWSY